jgi:hypothetical protein
MTPATIATAPAVGDMKPFFTVDTCTGPIRITYPLGLSIVRVAATKSSQRHAPPG